MDLVDFDRQIFDDIVDDFEEILPDARVHPIPMSALNGDNVITKSDRTPWFNEASLLEYLETVQVDHQIVAKPFRMPIQLVSRPDQEFRGYAGQILAGSIRVGDPITAWPSGHVAHVKRIVTWDGDIALAHAPMSVTLVLDDESDISRGDTITGVEEQGLKAQGSRPPHVGRRFEADVVWMDERPLDPARLYLLKHTTRTVTVEANRPLALNQIETVTLTTSRPIVFDRYRDIRATGSFILIDPATNFTAGAGMIIDAIRDDHAAEYRPNAAERLVRLARSASSHEDAVAAMQRAIEELLK
jgi:sulfate adenylyltransferase subunit 1 (EFTu-like GTPase family)